MHVPNTWYLDCCPEVYERDETKTLQEALEEAVKRELELLLDKEDKNEWRK